MCYQENIFNTVENLKVMEIMNNTSLCQGISASLLISSFWRKREQKGDKRKRGIEKWRGRSESITRKMVNFLLLVEGFQKILIIFFVLFYIFWIICNYPVMFFLRTLCKATEWKNKNFFPTGLMFKFKNAAHKIVKTIIEKKKLEDI